MTSDAICLGHNIPRMLRAGSSTMCAVRLQNTRDRNLYFESHASFYGTPIKDTRHHLSIHVNGGIRSPSWCPMTACVPESVRRSYFPFHAGEPGEYRLQS